MTSDASGETHVISTPACPTKYVRYSSRPDIEGGLLNRDILAAFAVLPLIGGLVHLGVNSSAAWESKQQETQKQKSAERRHWIDRAVQQGIQRYEIEANTATRDPSSFQAESADSKRYTEKMRLDPRDGSDRSARFAAYRHVLENIGPSSFMPEFINTRIQQNLAPTTEATQILKLQGSLIYTYQSPGSAPQLMDWKTEQMWDSARKEWNVIRSSQHFRGLLSNPTKKQS